MPGVAIVRVEGGLFFANADAVRAHIRAQIAGGSVHAIVLDVESTPFIDVTAAHMLVELADDLERDEVRFAMARSLGNVRDVIDTSEPDAVIWPTYPDVTTAVEALTAASSALPSST